FPFEAVELVSSLATEVSEVVTIVDSGSVTGAAAAAVSIDSTASTELVGCSPGAEDSVSVLTGSVDLTGNDFRDELDAEGTGVTCSDVLSEADGAFVA
ncbi:hypothetical protein WICPIJ_006579, partial [Wickerhamomyces pijperi]